MIYYWLCYFLGGVLYVGQSSAARSHFKNGLINMWLYMYRLFQGDTYTGSTRSQSTS